MKPDTQAADVVTAEHVSQATSVFFMQMAGDCLNSNNSIEAWHGCMRAALIASGLPAEVSRLRNIVERGEEAARNAGFRNWAGNLPVVINIQADELRKANEIGDNLRAELSRLRGELSDSGKLSGSLLDEWDGVPNDVKGMPELEKLKAKFAAIDAALKDQQP